MMSDGERVRYKMCYWGVWCGESMENVDSDLKKEMLMWLRVCLGDGVSGV